VYSFNLYHTFNPSYFTQLCILYLPLRCNLRWLHTALHLVFNATTSILLDNQYERDLYFKEHINSLKKTPALSSLLMFSSWRGCPWRGFQLRRVLQRVLKSSPGWKVISNDDRQIIASLIETTIRKFSALIVKVQRSLKRKHSVNKLHNQFTMSSKFQYLE